MSVAKNEHPIDCECGGTGVVTKAGFRIACSEPSKRRAREEAAEEARRAGELLPGSIHRAIEERLVYLHRFALEVVGEDEDEKEPADVRAWDLARAWLKRETDYAEREAAKRVLHAR